MYRLKHDVYISLYDTYRYIEISLPSCTRENVTEILVSLVDMLLMTGIDTSIVYLGLINYLENKNISKEQILEVCDNATVFLSNKLTFFLPGLADDTYNGNYKYLLINAFTLKITLDKNV